MPPSRGRDARGVSASGVPPDAASRPFDAYLPTVAGIAALAIVVVSLIGRVVDRHRGLGRLGRAANAWAVVAAVTGVVPDSDGMVSVARLHVARLHSVRGPAPR
jgi:hypothetical protein